MTATTDLCEYELALNNFGAGRTPERVVRSYATVKRAAFRALAETSRSISPELSSLVDTVWAQMADGEWADDMLLGMEQGGAGTSLHFQLMEIAWIQVKNRACQNGIALERTMLELLNAHQSTNDTLPSAMVVDALLYLRNLEATVIGVQEALVAREHADRSVLMVGRTQGQDALPMRWGQYWSAWAGVLERDRWRIARFQERIRVIPLGSTAIGTGLGSTAAYRHAFLRHLRDLTGLPLAQSQNPGAELSHQDVWSEYAGVLETLAGNLVRLSRELLEMVSEPDGVLRHPRLQAGSTLMPAKSNPVLLEFALGTALETLGEAAKMIRYAQEGRGQINALLPFLWQAVERGNTTCLKALGAVTTVLPLLTLDQELSEGRLRRSPALLNAMAITLGYEPVKNLWKDLSPGDFSSWETLVAALARTSGEPEYLWQRRLEPSRLTAAWEER